MFHILKPFFLVFLTMFSATVFALPTDSQQPFQIIADSTLLNYKTGVNTYEGHVKVNQGTSQLLADRVITKTDSHHKMQVATAYGLTKLADYITIPKIGDQPLHATAKIITFYPPTSVVVLEGTVTVTQAESNFQGPIIVYNMKDQIVTVPASKLGHSTIIIQPKQFNKA